MGALIEKKYSDLSEEEKKKLLDMYESLFEEVFQTPYTEKEKRGLEKRLAKDEEKRFLLWYDDKGRIKGFMQFRKRKGGDALLVDFIYLEKPERRKGVARMMVNRVYNIAREENAKRVVVIPASKASEKMFKSMYGEIKGLEWHARVSKGPRIPAHGFISRKALEILKKRRK